MTHLDMIVTWFSKRHNHATLGEILKSGEPWAHEWNARKTDLRNQGYVIILDRGPNPSGNNYTIMPPEENGQMRIAV